MESIGSANIANSTHDTDSTDAERIHHTHIGTSNCTVHQSGCGAPIKSTPKDITTYQLTCWISFTHNPVFASIMHTTHLGIIAIIPSAVTYLLFPMIVAPCWNCISSYSSITLIVRGG
jgi:hypothetical protein